MRALAVSLLSIAFVYHGYENNDGAAVAVGVLALAWLAFSGKDLG